MCLYGCMYVCTVCLYIKYIWVVCVWVCVWVCCGGVQTKFYFRILNARIAYFYKSPEHGLNLSGS